MLTPTDLNINHISIIYTTVGSTEVAEKLAQQAIESRLAVCVNIIPNIVSFYRWEGQIEKSSECILLFKTSITNCELLMEWIRKNHPYAVPALFSAQAPALEDFCKYIGENN